MGPWTTLISSQSSATGNCEPPAPQTLLLTVLLDTKTCSKSWLPVSMLRLTICSFLKEIDDVATECERELPYHLEKIKARDLNLNMCNSFQISAASHWCRESMDLTHCWSSNLFAELVRDSLHRVGDSLAELDQESFWSGDKHWNCFNQLVDQTRDFRIETNYLPGSAPAHCERCSWTLNDERHLQIEWPWRFELKSENFRPALPHGYGRCDRTSSIFSPKTFIGDFGKDHQYAITRFGLLNSVCIDFIVWPNQFDFSTPPPDLAGWWGSLDEPQNAPYYETKGNSYRQTWLDCMDFRHFDAISQSYDQTHMMNLGRMALVETTATDHHLSGFYG